MRKRLQCIDVNTKYCPCLLAETNQCILCSQLQGKDFCSCDWPGICIFNLKEWQKPLTAMPDFWRREEEVTMTASEAIGINTYKLSFALSADFAAELSRLGAFLFFRLAKDPLYFQFPVAVYKITGSQIEVIVEIIGPKTRRLWENRNDSILVRGPYFNGLLGQPWIDKISCGTILLIVGGIGQAPALAIAQKLRNGQNEVKAFLAPGQVGTLFCVEDLAALGVTVYPLDSLRQTGFAKIREWFITEKELPDVIVSAGPDVQHQAIIKILDETHVNLPLVVTNNAVMCCGEGVCGSCQKKTKTDETVRLCKVQTDFDVLAEVLKEE
ncbi:MAG: hypothetical protein E6713_16500 [Sporomusaceae bacterium]|nr:hypothetical protein [Sporomusaceae bacterium]